MSRSMRYAVMNLRYSKPSESHGKRQLSLSRLDQTSIERWHCHHSVCGQLARAVARGRAIDIPLCLTVESMNVPITSANYVEESGPQESATAGASPQ